MALPLETKWLCHWILRIILITEFSSVRNNAENLTVFILACNSMPYAPSKRILFYFLIFLLKYKERVSCNNQIPYFHVFGTMYLVNYWHFVLRITLYLSFTSKPDFLFSVIHFTISLRIHRQFITYLIYSLWIPLKFCLLMF